MESYCALDESYATAVVCFFALRQIVVVIYLICEVLRF